MSWYEKYRPKTVDEVIGKPQKQAIKTLLNGEEIHQRVLFKGPSGTGKTTAARIYASHINDGEYRYFNCREIGVNEIRQYMAEVKRVAPLFTDYSVVLLDEVDALHDAAQQQLLDIEDIPDWMVILAATKDTRKMRKDLLSRFLTFTFKTPTRMEIGLWLTDIFKAEDFEPDKEKVGAIINSADGNLRTILNGVEALASGADPVESITEESPAFKELFTLVCFKKFQLGRSLELINSLENPNGFAVAVCRYILKNPTKDIKRTKAVLSVFGEGLSRYMPEDVALAHLFVEYEKQGNK